MKISYVVLIRSSANQTQSLQRSLQSLPKTWRGVELLPSFPWFTFGAYDAILGFHSESPEEAMQFVLEKIRPIEGVVFTETLQGKPLSAS